ncbi:ribbon-helix-helix domain-containing protein [Calidithermus chliarophilus]|uniref:ribbon-helix-helix domain-containing protein n=1 Tax=Calidithermus chliarophilus TaxID=52023 RepID=UPI00040856C0|nr:Arc family DNA-binding protein [Calidithermus chliarophilus]
MAEKKKFLLRIDPELYEALERWADDEFRSVNAQIEFVLRESVRRAGRLRVKAQSEAPAEED